MEKEDTKYFGLVIGKKITYIVQMLDKVYTTVNGHMEDEKLTIDLMARWALTFFSSIGSTIVLDSGSFRTMTISSHNHFDS